MVNIKLSAARSLEAYIPLGPDPRFEAKEKAQQWIAENEAGVVRFEDGVLEVLDRIIAA